MGSSDEDSAEEEMELRPVKRTPWVGVLKDLDMLGKEWGWEMLLPYKCNPDWSDYCNYLGEYFKLHHSVIAQDTGISLVDAAETCLKKEGELVSLWDSRMKECTVDILPINTFILSSLIQKFADKIKRTGEALSGVSTAALLCITKEADLICKMLSVGAKPADYIIIQSTEIRMCALSLTSHQLCGSVPAAAAMVGIMKETNKICDWIRQNRKPFDESDMDLDNDFELGRQVRQGTLYFMTSMLEKSPFNVSAAPAEQKPVEEKYFSGSIPRNDGNDTAPAEAASSTGGNTQDQEKITSTDSGKKRRMEDADKEASDQELGSYPSGSKLSNLGHGDDHGVRLRLDFLSESSDDSRKNQMEICTDKDRMALDSPIEDLEEDDDAKTVPPVGIVKFLDVFEKTRAWDRLVPLKISTEWSDYCNYVQQYYKHNASVLAEVTGSLVASANVCLKKEEELVSLWKTLVLRSPIVILPVNTTAQSNLIQEHAHSFIFSEEAGLPVASTVAFAQCCNRSGQHRRGGASGDEETGGEEHELIEEEVPGGEERRRRDLPGGEESRRRDLLPGEERSRRDLLLSGVVGSHGGRGEHE